MPSFIESVNRLATGISSGTLEEAIIVNKTIVSEVIPNLPEILLADDNASIATQKASEASVSANNALTQANRAESEADRAEGYANGVFNIKTNTIAEMEALTPINGDVCFVKDLDRGGTFIYDSTKVAEDNQGTNFSGWIRQYSGAVNVKWFGETENKLYVSSLGLDTNNGINSNKPVSTINKAIQLLSDYNIEQELFEIIFQDNSFLLTEPVIIDSKKVKIIGNATSIDATGITTSHAFLITNSYVEMSNISILGCSYSAIYTDKNGYFKGKNLNCSNNGWRGIQAINGGELYLENCTTSNNLLSGIECLLNSKGIFYNCISDSNGWAGFSATNSSICYINKCSGNLNTRYFLECAGTSKMYARDCSATNGSLTAAAYLVSGASLMTLHTCTATDCVRPFMAEYAGNMSTYNVSAISSTLISTYTAFYAEYSGKISLVTTPTNPCVVNNYTTAFKAKYGGQITSTKPTYLTLTNVTIQSSPLPGLYDNSNSFVDMDVVLGEQQKQYGTYTPTLTNTTNIASSTAYSCQYSRVGNIVTVSGAISVTPTALGAFNLKLTHPTPSNTTAFQQVAGVGRSYTNTGSDSFCINGDSVNDVADIRGYASITSAQIYTFSYTYQVL